MIEAHLANCRECRKVLAWIDTYIVDGIVNLVRHITVFPLGHGSNLFDKYIVDGLVNGVARMTAATGGFTRRVQTGYVRSYALGVLIGAVATAIVLLGVVVFA